MPFKVVQTIEQGKICISAVPSGWEINGTLWWPPKSQTGNICDEQSKPTDKWIKFPCVVKRQYITYKEAAVEAKKMEVETDTEHEEDNRNKGNTNTRSYAFGDFNSLLIQQENYQVQPNAPVELQIGENVLLDDCNLDGSFILKNNNEYSEILRNQKTIIDMLEKQAENTTRILTQLSKHEAKTEACFSEIYNKINPNSNIDSDYNNIMIERFPPVKTIDEMKNLEENLKNASFKAKYINSMSNLCSQGSNMKGLTLCYKLIDYFIARDLLLECSWTGNARNYSENEKTAFKFFERIRDTFLSIIRNGDPSFSQVDCDQFFKRILKNSKQRLLSTVKPQSTSTPNDKKLNRKILRSPKKSRIAAKNNKLLIDEQLPTLSQNANTPPNPQPSAKFIILHESVLPENPSPRDEAVLPINPSPEDEAILPENPSLRDEAVLPVNPSPRVKAVLPVNPSPGDEAILPENPSPRDEAILPENPSPRDEAVLPVNPSPGDKTEVTENTTATGGIKKTDDAIRMLLRNTEKKKKRIEKRKK